VLGHEPVAFDAMHPSICELEHTMDLIDAVAVPDELAHLDLYAAPTSLLDDVGEQVQVYFRVEPFLLQECKCLLHCALGQGDPPADIGYNWLVVTGLQDLLMPQVIPPPFHCRHC